MMRMMIPPKVKIGAQRDLLSQFAGYFSYHAGRRFFLNSSPRVHSSSFAVSNVNMLHGPLSLSFLQKYGPLLSSFVPVTVAILGCKGLGMGAEKEIALSVSRCSVQLAVLAFALKYVFEGDRLISTILALSFMVLVAGWTAGNRVQRLSKSHLIAISALACGTLSVLGVMSILQAFPTMPRYIIPIAGYVIGNSMSIVGATMHGLRKDIVQHRGQIEAALALGATPSHAVQSYVRHAVAQGMAPWIDSIKVAGMITIPGSVTGMLMVKMRPIEVVRIQLQILYMLLGSAALSSVISSLLSCRVFFTENFQLVGAEA